MKHKKPTYKALRLAALLTAAAILAAMWFFSSQTAAESSRLSGKIVDFLLRFLRAEPESGMADRLSWVVRKVAHFSLFMCFGIALGVALGAPGKAVRALLAVPASALCALGDEAHQYFVAGRGPTWRDCLLDSCGALTGALIALFVWTLVSRRSLRRSGRAGTDRM